MNIGKRVEIARKHAGMTKAMLARACGLTNQAIGQIENGTTKEPKPSNLQKIAVACNVSSDWLIDGEGEMTQIRRSGKSSINIRHEIEELRSEYNATRHTTIIKVPLISKVRAGEWCNDATDEPEALDWLICPVKVGKNAFALKVQGVSMEPEYHDGDIIFVDPDKAPKHNDDVVVSLIPSGEATFKRLQIDESGKYLIAINKSFPAPIIPLDEEARICGIVVFSGRFRSN
ncbi:helix-turn-helix domain-containing protein [Methylophaga lonarensis]|uniref:helix-turn-helix domain-containing protein n=1 Tax=Methylophaga lonarensis TaxID=999151 RepID=UPI003D2B30B4